MTKTARHLGGWMPGSEPKFLSRGTALHVCVSIQPDVLPNYSAH